MRHAALLLLLPLTACEWVEDLTGLGQGEKDTGSDHTGYWHDYEHGTDYTDYDYAYTFTESVPPLIVGWSAECVDEETFVADLYLDGVASSFAVLDLWETGAPDNSAWNEEHAIFEGRIELIQVADVGDVGDGAAGSGTTLFGCGVGVQFDYDETMLTYAVRVYDIEGNFADCIQFGHEPYTVSDGTYTTIGGKPSNEAELAICRTLN